jgi:hypothetical protein
MIQLAHARHRRQWWYLAPTGAADRLWQLTGLVRCLQAFAAPQRQRRRCVSANVAAAERTHTASGAATQAHDNFLAWLTVLLACNLHASPP